MPQFESICHEKKRNKKMRKKNSIYIVFSLKCRRQRRQRRKRRSEREKEIPVCSFGQKKCSFLWSARSMALILLGLGLRFFLVLVLVSVWLWLWIFFFFFNCLCLASILEAQPPLAQLLTQRRDRDRVF